MLLRRRHRNTATRPGLAAVEFCIVSTVLFVLFLGMVELGRAMMALGAVANAARVAARAGAVTPGGYTSAVSAANNALSAAGVPGAPQVAVTVNGVAVSDDASFAAAAAPGSAVSVKVGVNYSDVSWLPAGAAFFLSAGQVLSESATFCKEG